MLYVFKNFFGNGSIMAYYDSESFLFENRDFLLEFSEKFYQGVTSEKLFKNSNVHKKYLQYLTELQMQKAIQNKMKSFSS